MLKPREGFLREMFNPDRMAKRKKKRVQIHPDAMGGKELRDKLTSGGPLNKAVSKKVE